MVPTGALSDQFTPVFVEPLTLAENQSQAEFVIRIADRPDFRGEQTLKIRATAKQQGRWPVISETTVLMTVRPD